MTEAMLDALKLWFVRREATILAGHLAGRDDDRLPLDADWGWLDEVAPWAEADNDQIDAA